MKKEAEAYIAYGLVASVSFGIWQESISAGFFCAMVIILLAFIGEK